MPKHLTMGMLHKEIFPISEYEQMYLQKIPCLVMKKIALVSILKVHSLFTFLDRIQEIVQWYPIMEKALHKQSYNVRVKAVKRHK